MNTPSACTSLPYSWSSDAVSLFNVQGVPHTVLLNPKGEVVAFNLRGEEMLNKVKRIIEGVETYE